jgi:hypothetical protein
MAGNTNISSLIPSSINNNLSKVSNPKAFGDQAINSTTDKLKTSSLGKIETIKNDIQNIIKKIIDLEVNHVKTLVELKEKASPRPPAQPTLSNEEYQIFVTNENNNYQLEKTQLEAEKIQLQQKLNDILNDPYKKIKDIKIETNIKIKKLALKNKVKLNKEKKQLALKVLKNTAKSLVPIVALQGTKLLFILVFNIKKIQDLVDNTNAAIDAATTQQDINSARVLRNSTLSLINDTERKISSLLNLITTLNTIVFILNIILRLSNIILPIPTPPGPVPDIVTHTKERFRKKYETAVKLVDGLSVIISIFQGILSSVLNELNDLKAQLKNINDLLDNISLNNLSDEELQLLINDLQNQSSNINSSQIIEYKGFKLKIKEEENSSIVVRGNIKRRYAVAINKNGIEVVKSEFSFTLDPPDLIEQLKLIIDQQNLQG